MKVHGYQYDTMIAHTAVSPDEPHDLGHIVFTYTDAPPWKADLDDFETPSRSSPTTTREM